MNIVGDAANAPCLVHHPDDPDKIVVGWRQFDSAQSDFREAGWAYSSNNGATWTFPGVIQNGTFRSQPVLGANTQGRLFYLSLGLPSRLSSSFTGLNWSVGFAVPPNDKAWMAIDRTGGIGTDNIYVVWNGHLARDGDLGGTFATVSLPSGASRYPSVSVAHDGSVFVAGRSDCSYVRVSRSTNAQDLSQTPVFSSTLFDFGGATRNFTGPNPGGFLGQVWIATDHSNGASRGNVYVLSSVDPPGEDPLDVMFARSEDNGQTWSDPIRVNPDPPDVNAWQWFGNMSVAPNGRIDVIWNDTSNQSSINISRLYYSSSADGGRNWSLPVPVSPPFDSFVGWPGDDHKLGDYYHLVSANCAADIVYSATFNGEQDVYFLRVNADCNSNGISDCDEVDSDPAIDCNQNWIPDECEVDCNANGASDACDLLDGTSADCNANRVPDECEPDCNANHLPDDCDISSGVSLDCQPDGVPDECQRDCNQNGRPDDCDIAEGASIDSDENGVPDECQLAFCQLSRLLPADAAEFGLFGCAVDLTRDLAVVAAVGDQTFGSHSGAVYAYRRDGTGWRETQKLLTPVEAPESHFGNRVAMFGDTLAVSTPGDESVHMYWFDGGQWVWQARVVPNQVHQGAGFSGAIALTAGWMAVSAPEDTAGDSGRGAVYVFRKMGTDWAQDGRLTTPDAEIPHTDRLGSSVALDGETLVVGAREYSCPSSGAGAAFVYRRIGNSWVFSQVLMADVPGENDAFGESLAIDNGWLVIGAPRTANPAPGFEGRVHVFSWEGGSWKHFQTLAPIPSATWGFGISVDVEGSRIVVGSVEHGDSSPQPGAAYVFRFDGSRWLPDGHIVMPEPTAADQFGHAVALCGGALLVGAPANDSVATNNGIAYVFSVGEDCNGDRVADGCNLDNLTSVDCNGNLMPDECESLRPDGDFDGDVDLVDYSLLLACIRGPDGGLEEQGCCHVFDQEYDQDADLADFAVFQTVFGGP